MARAPRRAAAAPAVAPGLGPRLRALSARGDVAAWLARDPLRFPRRYRERGDVEVAAVFAALLAFGRVDLFGPVLETIFAQADARGGPRAWVEGFDEADAERLAPVYYRWHDGDDFARLARLLQAVYARHASLGDLFRPGPAGPSLDAAVRALRALVPAEAGGLPRAFRTWLPLPSDGSACKRWLMLLRWMVRPEAPDLGRWTHLSPRDLVIPVDTHVHRVARFVGLTARATADWRAAEEITAGLRAFDPDDPVRFDFALAHLGISGACRGARDPAVCPACPLDPVCRAG